MKPTAVVNIPASQIEGGQRVPTRCERCGQFAGRWAIALIWTDDKGNPVPTDELVCPSCYDRLMARYSA